jgi:hypothetical protein
MKDLKSKTISTDEWIDADLHEEIEGMFANLSNSSYDYDNDFPKREWRKDIIDPVVYK